MRQAKGFSVQNELTVKLLLLLAVCKDELIAARWDEFELEADPPVWHLPGIRTKTGQPLDIPLPSMALEWLRKLKELVCNAAYVLPARKLQTRMVPHVCESTLGVANGESETRLAPLHLPAAPNPTPSRTQSARTTPVAQKRAYARRFYARAYWRGDSPPSTAALPGSCNAGHPRAWPARRLAAQRRSHPNGLPDRKFQHML